MWLNHKKQIVTRIRSWFVWGFFVMSSSSISSSEIIHVAENWASHTNPTHSILLHTERDTANTHTPTHSKYSQSRALNNLFYHVGQCSIHVIVSQWERQETFGSGYTTDLLQHIKIAFALALYYMPFLDTAIPSETNLMYLCLSMYLVKRFRRRYDLKIWTG